MLACDPGRASTRASASRRRGLPGEVARLPDVSACGVDLSENAVFGGGCSSPQVSSTPRRIARAAPTLLPAKAHGPLRKHLGESPSHTTTSTRPPSNRVAPVIDPVPLPLLDEASLGSPEPVD